MEHQQGPKHARHADEAEYIETYSNIDDNTPAKAQDAAYANVTPQNIPAHNVDHPTYTKEVTKHLATYVWNKFKPQGGDHKIDAKWLADELDDAAKEFESYPSDERGIRKSGTVAAWRNRFNDLDWAEPFSMADVPPRRKAGKSTSPLAEIFKHL